MSTLESGEHDGSHLLPASRLLWPTAAGAFLFTVSYPINDFAPPPSPPDIGLGMLLVFIGIALVTTAVVFAVVLPRALRRETYGRTALALSVAGTLLAPGFWTGFPPILAAGGALLGWAGSAETKGRRLSRAALLIGVLGVALNVYSYADVFV